MSDGATRLLLSMAEAASCLSVGSTTMKKLVRERKVLAVKVGTRTLIPFESLESYKDGLLAAALAEAA